MIWSQQKRRTVVLKIRFLNTRVSEAINKAISIRGVFRDKAEKSPKIKNKDELVFGRPGKILHVDGDSDYMETCLKVYKQLYLDAVGKSIPESETTRCYS